MHLTDIVIKNLPVPEEGQRDYRDDSIQGFMCRVSKAGTRTFYLMHGARRQRTSLGKYPLVSLKMARQEAQRLLAEQTLSQHPQSPRQTFLMALEAFLTFHAANNRPGTTGEVSRILTRQFAPLHRKQIADVTTHDITQITDGMIAAGHPSAANHAHIAIRNFLGWCVRRRYLPHSPINDLERPAKAVSRERTLTDEELRAVWRAAGQCSRPFSAIVRLLIVSGQRRGEIGGMRREWFDLEARTCTFPSEITKNSRTHHIPIGGIAHALLSECQAQSDTSLLFPARGTGASPRAFNGWSKAKPRLDGKASIDPWTLHDLRRTYATNLQKLGVKLEVIEALLNHVSGTRAGIVGVYQRYRYEVEMREAVDLINVWFTRVILEG